jgi:2-ketoarginine methyltransferase
MLPTETAQQRQPDGHARAFVDPAFEQRLVEATRPIAAHYLAMALHHMFTSGIFDRLVAGAPVPIPVASLARDLGMDEHRLRGLLLFLANEGILTVDDDEVALTAKGRGYGEFRAWYTMMIGGYAATIQGIGAALPAGSPHCSRDGRFVGPGSCEVSRYDGIPIVRTLLADAGVTSREVLDLGCGNGLYLVELCREIPGVNAWGTEPDEGGYEEAVALVQHTGMADRIRLRHDSALGFLADPPADCHPDLIVFGFVLHEILAQDGEAAVVDLLRGVVERFPRINVVVIEVADRITDPAVMRHGVARNFWNPYYLIHYFTPQRLESQVFWEGMFAAAGLQVARLITTDPAVDSTGLELGYLLRGASW